MNRLAIIIASFGMAGPEPATCRDQEAAASLLEVVRDQGRLPAQRQREVEHVITETLRGTDRPTGARVQALRDDFVVFVGSWIGPAASSDAEGFDLAVDSLQWSLRTALELPQPAANEEDLATRAATLVSDSIGEFVEAKYGDVPSEIRKRLVRSATARIERFRGRLVNRFFPDLLEPMPDRIVRGVILAALESRIEPKRFVRLWPSLGAAEGDRPGVDRVKQFRIKSAIDDEAGDLSRVAIATLRTWFSPPAEASVSMPEELIAKYKAHEAKAEERRRRAEEREATRPERAGGRRLLRDAGVIMVGGRPVPPRFADVDADATSPPLAH